MWAELEALSERRNEYLRREPFDTSLRPLVFDERDWQPEPPPRRSHPSPRLARRADPVEALRAIPAPEYVERLAGEEVGPSRIIRCPLAGHEDRSPSFKVNAGGWRCFGCGEAGRIFELAAALWGLSTRGRDFVELKERLAAEFGLAA